jgi:hypothetical protein
MSMLSRSFLVLFLVSSLSLGGVVFALKTTLFSELATQEVDIARESCPNQIENYRNAVNWYQGPNRITVTAKSACGSKYGDEYELSDVTIEIRSGNLLIAQAHSNDGAFWPARHEMLIGKSDAATGAAACIPEFDLMQIDLKTGEMKTPGMQAVFNSKEAVNCSLHLNQNTRSPSHV